MRVVAGTAQGRPLRTLPSPALRPTAARVRMALFSMLEALDADLSSVLDLYAGTGSLGIEALSRGAGAAVFVERDRALCRQISANLLQMGLAERATVLSLTVEQALPTLRGLFTLVFADPPYRDVAAATWTMTALLTSPAIAEGGLLALEHATRADPSVGAPAEWVQLRQRAYGDTSVSIYRMERRGE